MVNNLFIRYISNGMPISPGLVNELLKKHLSHEWHIAKREQTGGN
jgi:hypothetical protein